jgi:hypothetical protein
MEAPATMTREGSDFTYNMATLRSALGVAAEGKPIYLFLYH